MLNNKQIQERIRYFGEKAGYKSDNAICKRCNFNDATMIGKIDKLKTAPQLDTLDKFAKGLGIDIVDLIINRSDADIELSKLIKTLTEYEKTEVVVYIKMMQKEKNQEQRMVA